MKIGIFTDTYLPDVNGVVTSVVTLKKALEMHGHEVYIVTNHDDLLKTTYNDRVLRLPGLRLDFLYGYKLTNPIQIAAAKPIKEWNLDIIHVHQEFGVGIFGRAVASAFGIPLVNTYHTTYEDYTHYVNFFNLESMDILSKKAVEGLSKTFTKKSDIVITPSIKTKEMLERYGIKKQIEVIPTGLDLDRFDIKNIDQTKVQAIKDEKNITDETVFIYVGRIAKEKSVEEVVRTFKIVKDRNINAKLIIVGDGPDFKVLTQLVVDLDLEDTVFFEGLKESHEVPTYYHASDAFISASTTETQGLTYIEALACGLGVFAKRDEVLDEIVVEGKTGFYFDDMNDLADKIQTFTENKEIKTSIYQNSLDISLNYSLEVYYNKMIKCYEDAIEIDRKDKHDKNKID